MRMWIAAITALLVGCLYTHPVSARGTDERREEVTLQSFAGAWEGEMQPPRWRTYLHLSLDFSDENAGRLYTVGQTIPLGDPQIEEETLTVSLVGPWSITPRIHFRHVAGGLEGEWEESGARYPMQLRPVAQGPEPIDRTMAWTQDIDTLENRFLPFDRSYSPEARQAFGDRMVLVRDNLEEMTDAEVMVALSQAVALADNAHTRLYLLRNRTVFRRLPIRFWWFGDSLRIVRATDSYAGQLGCQVDTISGVEALAARARASTAFAGNRSWTDYKSAYFLSSAETLEGLGLAAADTPIEFGLSDCESETLVSVEALALERSDTLVESWWDLSPQLGARDGWQQQLAAQNQSAPIYLTQSDHNHRFQRLDDPALLYVQFNRSERMDGQDFDDFSDALLDELQAQPTRALVIDLRFNTGGNASVLEDLTERLAAASSDMRRYVITGRATFSAGITVAAQWRGIGDVTIIGEPVGDRLDYWAEGGNIILPNSGISAHFANGAHRYSGADCPDENYCLQLEIDSLAPDIPLSPTWSDYIAGRDAVLDRIIADIGIEQP